MIRTRIWIGQLASLVASSCTLLGCGTAITSSPNASRTVVDDIGRHVTIALHRPRVVSLTPGNTEIVCALGATSELVGVDQDSTYPQEAQKLSKIGVSGSPSEELIAAAAPDVVLASTIQTRAFVETLTHRGLSVVVVNATSLDEVLRDVQLIGDVVQRPTEAARLRRSLAQRIATVRAKVRGAKHPKTFIELTPDLYTAGQGTFLNELVEVAGGENVAKTSGQPWPQFSKEAVVMLDPEIILMTDHPAGASAEAVHRRSGWESIRAVKNNRIYVLNADITVRPGPRIVDGLEELVRVLHPEVKH